MGLENDDVNRLLQVTADTVALDFFKVEELLGNRTCYSAEYPEILNL